MLSLARPLAVLAFASAPALAGVLTVDDSGGADFTDLPPAVAAASSGDTLLVHPGTYSAFLLDGKPLTVLGLAAGQVAVLGTTRVRALGAGPATVLCQLDFERLKKLMRGNVFVDCRNVYSPDRLEKTGFKYESFGRGKA